MRSKFYLLIGITLLGLYSCNDKKKGAEESTIDTHTVGTINISVDENYQPVIAEQIRIFEGRNPQAHIIASYKPEEDCIDDFLNNKARMILITRTLNAEEEKVCASKEIPITRSLPIVRDGIAFVTNKKVSNKLTEVELNEILKGKKDRTVVFDNQKSATLRYVSDSILRGAPLSKNIFAAKGCADLISFVERNENAIGVLGFSWLSAYEDSATASYLSKINIALIQPIKFSKDAGITHFGPYQSHVLADQYPYKRDLNFTITEPYSGLGTSFANYLCRDGQLVFNKWKLVPLRHNIISREVNITTKQKDN